MSSAYRLYFEAMLVLLRIPLIRRAALTLHVTAGTYRATRPENEPDLTGPAGRFLAAFQIVRRNMPSSRRRRAVFMVYEPRFRRIVEELTARQIDVVFLGRGLFDYMFQKHLSEYLTNNKRGFSEYALQAYVRYPTERRRYLRGCTYVAELLKRTFAVDAIVLPKYNDDYTLEIVQAFHVAGWSTIVYDREGTVTRKRLEQLPAIVARQASACDAVVTYNETHKAFFERVFELSAVHRPEIVVMGNPVSDDWFHDEALRNGRKRGSMGRQLLFFAFGEFSYVYDEQYLKGKDEVWRALLTDVHESLASHLETHSDDRLLYKRGAKGNRDYWQGSERLLELANARLVPSTASANRLIAESDVVIAFQTTALIDAMHTDKVLIYCAWGDRYEELKGGLIDFEDFARGGAILHARSPAEFRRLLALQPSAVKIDLEARQRIRECFTTNPDGNVASRFADWVAARIAEKRAPAPVSATSN
jgi:hypothetical protein